MVDKQKPAVLFLQAPQELIDGLERMAAKERSTHPGRSISRADVVRGILYKAIQEANQ